MTHSELWERIKLTIESPPAIIEYEHINCRGFFWWEQNMPFACIGTAVAMVGYKLDERCCLRNIRAEMLEWEWSYLMHFEMAINKLFEGNIMEYNYTGYFPYIKPVFIPELNEDNYYLLEKCFI